MDVGSAVLSFHMDGGVDAALVAVGEPPNQAGVACNVSTGCECERFVQEVEADLTC